MCVRCTSGSGRDSLLLVLRAGDAREARSASARGRSLSVGTARLCLGRRWHRRSFRQAAGWMPGRCHLERDAPGRATSAPALPRSHEPDNVGRGELARIQRLDPRLNVPSQGTKRDVAEGLAGLTDPLKDLVPAGFEPGAVQTALELAAYAREHSTAPCSAATAIPVVWSLARFQAFLTRLLASCGKRSSVRPARHFTRLRPFATSVSRDPS